MPHRVHQRIDVAAVFRPQPNPPAAGVLALQDLRPQRPGIAGELDDGTRLQLLAGMHQRLPRGAASRAIVGARRGAAAILERVPLEQEALDRPSRRHTPAEQWGGKPECR